MLAFLLSVPFLLGGFGGELFSIFKEISPGDERWVAFFIGFGSFFPVHFIASRLFHSPWCYLQTLEHELTHLFVGLFFLKIPTRIRVTAHEGGEIQQRGRGATGQTWISLAPYFFPTVAVAILPFAAFFEIDPAFLLGSLGWATAFHLVTNWTETSFRQTDLQKAGIFKTFMILPVMNLISYGSILAFVDNGLKGLKKFWLGGLQTAFDYGSAVFEKIF